ncbi:hypothetical protein AABB24_015408, partial [Solanum stoloniferum]
IFLLIVKKDSMEIFGLCKKFQEMFMNKNKKKHISAKKLQKKCKNTIFIVYVGEEKLKYEVQRKYLSSSFFKRFIDDFQEDIIIRDTKNLEIFVNSCTVYEFEYVLQFSKIQLYPCGL